MTDKEPVIQTIPIENLFFDLQNPRYDSRSSQREAITTIAKDQGLKLVNLAEDIVDKGLNPSELPIVTPTPEENGTFIVLEGNRRIAALKLLTSPDLIDSIGLSKNITNKYKALQERVKNDIPNTIECAVRSREEASHWIFIRHTGENDGVGVVPWDGVQTHRFRGASPAFQAIELVKSSDFLNEATKNLLPKIAITNIERVLGTPEARDLLGIDIKDRKLILKTPEEDALARLSILVIDVANKLIRVSDIDTKDERIDYAKKIASRPFPEHLSKASATAVVRSSKSTGGATTSTTKRIPPDRKTIIPTRFNLAIKQSRINYIYHELQKLNLEQFVNCGAVMFRVFIELSLDDFAQRHKISLKIQPKTILITTGSPPGTPTDMTLRQKLTKIADYLDTNNLCNKAELRGVRNLVSNRNHVLSVDSLNAYIHNKDYSPTPTDLKTTWDNMQVFIERIWTN